MMVHTPWPLDQDRIVDPRPLIRAPPLLDTATPQYAALRGRGASMKWCAGEISPHATTPQLAFLVLTVAHVNISIGWRLKSTLLQASIFGVSSTSCRHEAWDGYYAVTAFFARCDELWTLELLLVMHMIAILVILHWLLDVKRIQLSGAVWAAEAVFGDILELSVLVVVVRWLGHFC